MGKSSNKLVFAGLVLVFAVAIGVIAMLLGRVSQHSSERGVSELMKEISVRESQPTKGSVSLDNSDLYDELPAIDKYPLSIEGGGDVDLEVFASGEKAGEDYESWLIDIAKARRFPCRSAR